MVGGCHRRIDKFCGDSFFEIAICLTVELTTTECSNLRFNVDKLDTTRLSFQNAWHSGQCRDCKADCQSPTPMPTGLQSDPSKHGRSYHSACTARPVSSPLFSSYPLVSSCIITDKINIPIRTVLQLYQSTPPKTTN